MPLEQKICPLCGEETSRDFDRRQFRGYQVAYRICEACGFVFQSPRMTEAELQRFYRAEYRRLYQGAEGPDPRDLEIQKARAEALVSFLGTAGVDKAARHLDIGCSAGLLLEKTRERYGLTGVGIEPGDDYREYAQNRGFKVYASLDGMEEAGENRFDLVSAAHVLEHLPDPVGYLKQIRAEWLTNDGSLLVEVPNLYAHDCFEVAHMSAFSEHSLRRVLERSGFAVQALRKHGAPRSEILPLYITALAWPMDGNSEGIPFRVIAERGVRIKRRVGMARRRAVELLFPSRAWRKN